MPLLRQRGPLGAMASVVDNKLLWITNQDIIEIGEEKYKQKTRPRPGATSTERRGQETAPNIALPTMWAINQNLMRMFQNPAKQKGATLKVRSFLFGLWEVCILENEFTRMPPLRQRGSLGAMASVVDNKLRYN
eukprot:TRINITY_DN705_c0_g1_i9.p1 TRINITY_DN705_c0_g1~~TRINITY_DN705_c0_g1_i9.p1  ORF type:complete len:134 (-),score=14.45 TRINITY_DN705_c0_g1_i9:81-482(-)